MIKRIVSLAVILVLSVVCMTSGASAEGINALPGGGTASPNWNYTNSCTTTFYFSGTTAHCHSSLTGYNGKTTKVEITQVLQKKDSSGNWKVVQWWYEIDSGYIGSATHTVSDLSSGTYRLYTAFRVHAGLAFETITICSAEKTLK